jgi:UDP-4-amino-4,6-dideoxy-N-acetyl-beta-L-altrosamine transaminase
VSRAFLPYGRQTIDAEDERLVLEVLRSPYLTTGPMVGRIEQAFRDITGAPYAVVCSNGTAGLHLTALGLGWKPGDAVIVPTLTFLATANCATYVGAEPIFADVDPDSGLLRPEDLEAALRRARNKSVKAAIAVHLNGQCCDMPALAEICRAHGIVLVEDACHAIGSASTTPNGTVLTGACEHSAAAVFSLHPVKTATMGEGGIVTTKNASLAQAMSELRNHGITRDPARWQMREQGFTDGKPNPWYYEMSVPGFNYRATDLQCALGLSQLGKLARFIARRAELVAEYDRLLAPLAPIVRPIRRMPGQRPGWHLYVALVDFGKAGTTRADVMNKLTAAGIGTQVHYLPVHLQPYYRARNASLDLPGAQAYYDCCLSLPLHASMNSGDVARVVAALSAAIGLPTP